MTSIAKGGGRGVGGGGERGCVNSRCLGMRERGYVSLGTSLPYDL